MELLSVDNIKKHFGKKYAVNGVSFSIDSKQTLGLIGESGCGKTTLARVLMRLENRTSGDALIDGKSIFSLPRKQIRKEMRMIFQNLKAALNPQMNVMEIMTEAIAVHRKDISKKERPDFAKELLHNVRFPINSSDAIYKYPHELSGGERRRLAIAKTILTKPKLIIADEPVSALDVSIQAQIMDLLISLQDEQNVSYLFISHDLAIVNYISHRIAVMFHGKILEIGSKEEIINNPLHPYTKNLISTVLPLGISAKNQLSDIAKRINWEWESDDKVPTGCCYQSQCPLFCDANPKIDKDLCKKNHPDYSEFGKGIDHLVACHFLNLLKS